MDRRLLLACCALITSLLGFPSGAAAVPSCDRFASPSGSDSAAGTEAAPYRSAQHLADSLSAGQTGCLRAGTYAEELTLRRGGREGAPLTLRSYPGEKAVIRGPFWVARTAPYVVVQGLYLVGVSGDESPSPNVNADHVTFRDNDVQNENTAICFLLGDSHGEYGRADYAVIEDNRIHHCGILPAKGHDHGIYVEASANSRIEGNWFYENADYAIQLYPDADYNLIRGNVMDRNGKGITVSGDGGMTSTGNRIEGNVISNSKDRFNIEAWWPQGNPAPRENAVTGNCLKAGVRDNFHNGGIDEEVAQAFSLGQNDPVTNPGYEDAGRGDLRLGAQSACRGNFAGDPEQVPGPDNPFGPVEPAPSAQPTPPAREPEHKAPQLSAAQPPAPPRPAPARPSAGRGRTTPASCRTTRQGARKANARTRTRARSRSRKGREARTRSRRRAAAKTRC